MTFDIIGTLYEASDLLDAPLVALPGFHVNTTPEAMTEALAVYLVTPSPLRRVWAGDDPLNPVITVPLRFATEAEWLSLGLAAS